MWTKIDKNASSTIFRTLCQMSGFDVQNKCDSDLKEHFYDYYKPSLFALKPNKINTAKNIICLRNPKKKTCIIVFG